MKAGIRQSAAWLHSWGGLVLGWLCFAIFLTGTLAYYRQEISLWMRPELAQTNLFDPTALDHIADDLARTAPDAQMWQFNLPDDRHRTIRVFYTDAEGTYHSSLRDPGTGQILYPRDTEGGDFFYRFHFELMFAPTPGRIVSGICAMFMLVAIISGIITHRRFFRDFFTFRPASNPQRSWLDGHNILGVVGLPFHILIIYSGLATLMFLYMPWGALVAYGGDRAPFFTEAYDGAPPNEPAGEQAEMVLLSDNLLRFQNSMADFTPGRLVINHPGDANATIQVFASETDGLSVRPGSILIDGVNGTELSRRFETSTVRESWNVIYGLHLGRFADPVFRFVLFVMGLGGTAMVGTGLILWSVKRQRNGAFGRGGRIVHVLNVATLAGLPLAVAVFFTANRLLPTDIAGRAGYEVTGFYLAVGAALAYAMFCPARRIWRDLFALIAGLFLMLPVFGGILGFQGGISDLSDADTVFLWMDISMLIAAGASGALAWRLHVKGNRASYR